MERKAAFLKLMNTDDAHRLMQHDFLLEVSDKINKFPNIQARLTPSNPSWCIDVYWLKKCFLSVPLEAQSFDDCYFMPAANFPDPHTQDELSMILINLLFHIPLESREKLRKPL